MTLIPRTAAASLRRLARGFLIVAITGPRQAGKTTLARLIFPQKPYVTLEDPEGREFAASDPRRFLARFAEGAGATMADGAGGQLCAAAASIRTCLLVPAWALGLRMP